MGCLEHIRAFCRNVTDKDHRFKDRFQNSRRSFDKSFNISPRYFKADGNLKNLTLSPSALMEYFILYY